MEVPARPPVNEVVLSAKIARQAAILGPLLPSVLGDWFLSHPRVQAAPLYQMPQELQQFDGLTPGPQIQLMGAPAEPRYWLVSDDDVEVVQIQTDYVALNWRRKDSGEGYIGYESLRRKFGDLLIAFENGLNGISGHLQPVQGELTYINLIGPSQLWSKHSEAHKVFRVQIPHADYERGTLAYSRIMAGPTGEFIGRLHVALQPTFEWTKREPQMNLTITVRSAELSPPKVESLLRFLDSAHEFAGKTFLDLLTPSAREFWRLYDGRNH